MELQIVTTEIIKPSVPNPHHLSNFNLSFLDQINPPFYVPLILFYNTKFHVSKISEIHNKLKKSLSETLTIFYPLAGRIKNPVSIDCNDEGVSYTEATATCTLSEFLKGPHVSSLNKFLPLDANVLIKVDGKQVHVAIQVSVLECGGLAIGICVFHRVCDMATMASFLRTWIDSFRGNIITDQDLALGSNSLLFPPLSSFPDDYESNMTNFYFHEENRSITRRFVFDASSIATLRAKATSENAPNPSRIETLTGFIAQRLMKALESVMISHAVNIRRRLDPPLPDTAFGNLLWFTTAFYSSSESKTQLSEYVETLREVLHGINAKNLRELNPEEAVGILSESLELIRKCDALKEFKFTSWCNMGLYDLDFGWGKPAWVAHMADAAVGRRADHQFMFLEGKNGGEIELWALLDEHDMTLLENDQEFTAFATPNPSVPLEF